MRFAHVLSRVTGTHWLITEQALGNISALLEARINGLHRADTLLPDDGGDDADDDTLPAQPTDAVIPVFGVIGKRLSQMELMCGGCDVDDVAALFTQANNDANVQRIVLHIDSPGGTVTGVPELAQMIYSNKTKPVIAVSDTLIGSAAYYIAAAADEIIVTPTCQVGSIGTVLAVTEATGNQPQGAPVRLRVFRSGADKMMGLDAPLSDEQSAGLQSRVDFLGDMFRSFVSNSRPSIPASCMTGLLYFGGDAVSCGLADSVVPTLREGLADSAGNMPMLAAPKMKAVTTHAPMSRGNGQQPVTVHVHTAPITVHPPSITVNTPDVKVRANTTIEKGAFNVEQNVTPSGPKKIVRDDKGNITGTAPVDA